MTYTYTMRLIAVNGGNYSDDVSTALWQELATIVSEYLLIQRGGNAIDIDAWAAVQTLTVGAGGTDPLLTAVFQAANTRARELSYTRAGSFPLAVKMDAGRPVKALADFYCVPPRPPECYHSFLLARQSDNQEIVVTLPNGAPAGKLAVLLTLTDV